MGKPNLWWSSTKGREGFTGHILRHTGWVHTATEGVVEGKTLRKTKIEVHQTHCSGLGMWKLCQNKNVNRGLMKVADCFKSVYRMTQGFYEFPI